MDSGLIPTCAFVADEVGRELQRRIEEVLTEPGIKPHLIENRSVKKRHVYRQIWQAGDSLTSFILKKFDPERSAIERRAIERWLPALGMADIAPTLLAVVATSDAEAVWHVYEDLGNWTLDADDKVSEGGPRDRGFLTAMVTEPDWERLKAVLASLARLHDASADHPLLGECRYWTGDLGGYCFSKNVRDAIAALEAQSLDRLSLSDAQHQTREALLERLWRLRDEAPDRCADLEAFGGPECLLHGDFGVRNAMVAPLGQHWTARLIDWDHAGVGPACYDLSTLLLQLPQSQRARALESYCGFRKETAAGWPSIETWNGLFDTVERSRFANMVIWPALWAKDGHHDDAFENLSAILSWFETLRPALQAKSAAEGRT